MEKNFLNIPPESGNGNQEVKLNAKANISLEDEEEIKVIPYFQPLIERI